MKRTDHRIHLTKQLIKESLARLVSTSSFSSITIAALCREAQISRTTFYSHYQHIMNVVDDILSDSFTPSTSTLAEEWHALHTLTTKPFHETNFKEYEQVLPACQRLGENPLYISIYLDPTLSDYILQQLYEKQKDRYVPFLAKTCQVPTTVAESLLRFVLKGIYSVNQALRWQRTEEWYRVHYELAKVLIKAFSA